MRKCRFDKIILIGQGTIGRNLAKYISSMESQYGYSFQCIIHESIEDNPVLSECKMSGINYICIDSKDELTNYFLNYKDISTLIVSGFNNYWFPSIITNLKLFTIVNYHNSYLPRYQGGNAITWAIFNEEKETGATWHYVSNKMDAGDIIWQKSFEIPEDVKAYEVSKKSMEIAYAGFVDFFPRIINQRINGNKQEYQRGIRELYSFSDFPMDGKFDLDCSAKTVYRLLRSMDYGKTSGWEKACVVTPEYGEVKVKSYRIVERNGIERNIYDRNTIYMIYDDEYCLKINLEHD